MLHVAGKHISIKVNDSQWGPIFYFFPWRTPNFQIKKKELSGIFKKMTE